nr:MAG TPA: hypothetical protein [Caudoviricetes sp.]
MLSSVLGAWNPPALLGYIIASAVSRFATVCFLDYAIIIYHIVISCQ